MENSLTKSKWGGERGKAGGEEREGRWEQGEVGMGEGGGQKIYLKGGKTDKEGNMGWGRKGKMCVCIRRGPKGFGAGRGQSTRGVACSSDAQGLSHSLGRGLAAVIKVFIWQAAQGGTEEAPPASHHPRVPPPSPVFPPQVRAIRGPGAAQAWRGTGGRGFAEGDKGRTAPAGLAGGPRAGLGAVRCPSAFIHRDNQPRG